MYCFVALEQLGLDEQLSLDNQVQLYKHKGLIYSLWDMLAFSVRALV